MCSAHLDTYNDLVCKLGCLVIDITFTWVVSVITSLRHQCVLVWWNWLWLHIYMVSNKHVSPCMHLFPTMSPLLQVVLHSTPASSKWPQSWLLLYEQSTRRVSVPVQSTSSRRMGRSVTMPYSALGWAMASAGWREGGGKVYKGNSCMHTALLI